AAGAVLATVNLPVTGAWQNWQNVTATVTLPAGNQVLQLVSTATPFNINWIDFKLAGSATPPPPPTGSPIPGIIQAENYSAMSGVQTESTADVNGGMDVGWIDPADWMNYNVSVATAGSYTASFRIATLYYGASLQLKNAAGAVLATVNLPVTGAWQNWQNVTATVTLPAGNQVLQLVSTATPFNINWIDFENKTGAAVQSTMQTASAATLGAKSDAMAPSLSLYPNPAQSSLTLTVNNNRTGKMTVQVVDPSGHTKKTWPLNKEGQTYSTELFVGDLAPGIYFLRIQIGDWTEIEKMLKL
ncbi:MAG TPA: carbohydrate-binding protein, partial [Puia sp.]|nr:carbohydrate-binding protein [Puia sp.]